MAADLDAIRRLLSDYHDPALDEDAQDGLANELALELPALVAEVEALRKRPTPQAWERLMREHQELQARLNRTCHQLRLAIAAACSANYPDDGEDLAHG